MEPSKNENKKNNYWIILMIILSVVVVSLIISQQESKPEKISEKKFPSRSHQERYSNGKRQDKPADDEDNDENEDQGNFNPNQDFIKKGYLAKDIKTLKDDWGLEASKIPDLKAKKRRGVVNTLAVDSITEKGSCSELVVILKESPHVSANDLSTMKINQSQEFADTRNHNDAVIRFAINKIIEGGNQLNYDVYVLKANSHVGTISGLSAGSGVYVALLSAFYSDCAIPKNLAITGEFVTEKEEIRAKIEPSPKKYQWRADRCVQCNKYSPGYHFIYDKTNGGKFEKKYFENATDPDSQWVFCTQKHYNEWWTKNVYNCSKCSQQRFGSCSCCGKYHSWVGENNDDKIFCSKNCAKEHYPKGCEEGKIVAIGGIGGKITAAIEKDCDTIIIPKSNSSDYQNEVPLSVQAKVKKLHEVESYKDLERLFLSSL